MALNRPAVVLLALVVLAVPGQGSVLDDVLGDLRETVHQLLPRERAAPEPDAVRAPQVRIPERPAAELQPVAQGPLEAAFACSGSHQGLLVHLREGTLPRAAPIVRWSWDFGDGERLDATTAAANPRGHMYDAAGTYTVTLSVHDALGERATTSKECTALPLPYTPVEVRRLPMLASSSPPVLVCGVAGAPLRPDVAIGVAPLAPPLHIDRCAASLERAEPETAAPRGPNGDAIGQALTGPGLLGGGPAMGLDPSPHAPQRPIATVQPVPRVEVHQAAVATGAPLDGTSALAVAGLAASSVLAVPRARRWMRWLLLAPVGLFTRVKDDELLDHPVRLQIVQTIEAEPGIHYQGLLRHVAKGNGVLEHHLRMLIHGGLVRQRNAGGYTCYFLSTTDRRLMDAHSVLKTEMARSVLDRLMAEPGRPVGQIAKDLGVTTKAVSYHLRRFEGAGLASLERQGRTVRAHAEPLAFMAAGAA